MEIGKWFTLNVMYKLVVHRVSLEKVFELVFRLHLGFDIISDRDEPKFIHPINFSVAVIRLLLFI
jgi:hypothetical protein